MAESATYPGTMPPFLRAPSPRSPEKPRLPPQAEGGRDVMSLISWPRRFHLLAVTQVTPSGWGAGGLGRLGCPVWGKTNTAGHGRHPTINDDVGQVGLPVILFILIVFNNFQVSYNKASIIPQKGKKVNKINTHCGKFALKKQSLVTETDMETND